MTGSRPLAGVAKWYARARPAVLLGVVAYLAWRIASGWPAVRSASVQFNALELGLSLIAALAAFFSLFAGWLILLRRAGWYRSKHLGIYLRIWWVSYLCRYVPGKVMVLVERARMGQRIGIPATGGAALAVLETLLAIVAAGWVSLLAVFFHASGEAGAPWIAVALSLVVLVATPLALRRVSRMPAVERRFPGLASIDLHPLDVAAALPAFLLHFVFLGVSLFLCARCLHGFTLSELPGLCGVYAVSQVVGLSTMIAPAGLGVREGVLGFQLSRVLPGGLAEAVAIGARLWFTLIELVAFGAVLWLAPALPVEDATTDR